MVAACEFEKVLDESSGIKVGDEITLISGFHSFQTNITIVPSASGFIDEIQYKIPSLNFDGAFALLEVGTAALAAILLGY